MLSPLIKNTTMRLSRILLTLIAAGTVMTASVAPFGASTVHAAPRAVAAKASTANDPITNKKPQDSSVIDYINGVYKFAAGIGGLLAMLMLIYAGYRYMTSYGDPEKISDAKDIIEKSLIGLTLLILAYVILNTLNPRTASNPCTPGQANCGSVDFSKPGG